MLGNRADTNRCRSALAIVPAAVRYRAHLPIVQTDPGFKQTLGWTTPKIHTPEAADRWTWIVIAAHTQLRLARYLTDDVRRPWERAAPPGRMTPARVRRGFPSIRGTMPLPASAPKPSRPGPQDQRTPDPANTTPSENTPKRTPSPRRAARDKSQRVKPNLRDLGTVEMPADLGICRS